MCVEVLEGSLFTCHVKVCSGGDKVRQHWCVRGEWWRMEEEGYGVGGVRDGWSDLQRSIRRRVWGIIAVSHCVY